MRQKRDYEVGVPPSFRWSQQCTADAVVVSLAGELDIASVQLPPLLLWLVESGPAPTIVLDMTELSFIDAYCVGLIVSAQKAAKARGRVLLVDGLHGVPARVFRLVGLLEPVLARRPCGDVSEGNAGDQ